MMIVISAHSEKKFMTTSDENTESGFTLVEIIVALAILSISLSVLLAVISNGARQADRADKLARATSLAQSLLAKFGTELPIQQGLTNGELADGFHWQASAQPYGDAADQQHWPVAAYTVSVHVLWGENVGEQSIVMSTIRLAPKTDGR